MDNKKQKPTDGLKARIEELEKQIRALQGYPDYYGLPSYYRKTPDDYKKPKYDRKTPDPDKHERPSYARPQEDRWMGCCYESELDEFNGINLQ